MRPKYSLKLIILSLLLTIVISGWLYRDSFNGYFFQDDWFNLRISNVKTFSGFLTFFIPRTDVVYYKPFGMQIPFFILSRVFGINPLPFHILVFITHVTNIILIFILIRLLIKRDNIALFTSFFYATSSIHYTQFFWPSAYSLVISSTFFFTSFIFFLLFTHKRRKCFYFLSVFTFIVGLLSNELVIVLPIILFLYLLFFKQASSIIKLVPYIIIGSLLFLFRFIAYPPPIEGMYHVELGRHVFNNLEAYLLWSFNWPEEMKAQLVNFITINSQFIKDFNWYFFVFILTLFINIVLFYTLPLVMIIRDKRTKYLKWFIFGICWFITGLLPVIFFPYHIFSYFLPISFVGIVFVSIFLFSYLLKQIYRFSTVCAYIAVFVLLANWLLVSITTIDFNSRVHWAPRRAKISHQLVDKAKKSYKGESFVYIPFSSENKLALNDQDGLRVAFNNENVVTVYQ